MPLPKLIHLRLERDLVKRLDYLTVEYDLYRTDLIEMLLEVAVEKVESGEWDMDALAEEFFEEVEEGEEEEDD